MRLMLVLLAALFSNFTLADSFDMSEDSIRNAFSGLTFIDGTLVAYGDRTAKVINKKCSELDHSHPLYTTDEFGSFGSEDTLLLQTQLSETDHQTFYVLFSEGPSADPQFIFIKANEPKKVWAAGTALAIPGNGSVYVSNRFNNNFTRRQKFSFTPSGLIEVKQPYSYVGIKTQTLTPLTLYFDSSATKPVAQLPKGSSIEVILTDEKSNNAKETRYLVKTPFGLLGWVWIPSFQNNSTVIDGIFFQGD